MSTLNQFPRPSAPSDKPAHNVRAAVISTEGGVTSIHRNVTGGVDSAMSAVSDATTFSEEEMRGLVSKKVQSFPSLPQTIVDIYALRRSSDPDPDKLLKILWSDSVMAGNIVRISNSAAYRSSNVIKTPKEALARLGTRMVINVAMSTTMSAHLKPDLSPYGVSVDSFAHATSTQGLIIRKWKEPKFSAHSEDVQFAALLQEIGALMISKIALDRKNVQIFQAALAEGDDRLAAEESVFWMSSGLVAAIVFSEWKFSQEIIDYIAASDRPETAQESAIMGARALKIAKILAPLEKPKISESDEEVPKISEAAIETARGLVTEYGFSQASFDAMIESVNDQLDA